LGYALQGEVCSGFQAGCLLQVRHHDIQCQAYDDKETPAENAADLLGMRQENKDNSKKVRVKSD